MLIFLGNICHVIIKCGSEKFLTTITQLSKEKLGLKKGTEVFINFKATDITLI
ncbi:hypothetical protein LCGC14_1550340 [marine sediment metagenome]|uniref:Transport-associated OB type 1 domain-containing protein n=1 Tax=marine sediment metagenome TaxID=412755 RepID=A0A0F9LR97_9ZZZZ|nr:MAG: TOBE domain protein [Candidatus Lokiarchaeum sp. GC14_75]